MDWAALEKSLSFLEPLIKVSFFTMFLGFKTKKIALKIIIFIGAVGGQLHLVKWLSEKNIFSDIINFDGPWSPVVYITATFLFSFIFLKGNFMLKLATSCIVELFLALNSMVGMTIASMITGYPLESVVAEYGPPKFIAFSITKITFLLAVIIVLKCHKSIRSHFGKNELKIIAKVGYPSVLITLFVINMLVQLSPAGDIAPSLFAVFSMIIINIYIMVIITRYAKANVENAHLRDIKINDKAMKESIETSALFKHDYINHLATVAGLLKDGLVERAFGYTTDLVGKVETELPKHILTKSPIANAALNVKANECAQKEIELNYHIDTDIDFIEDSDFSAVLHNALDNAIAGCTGAVKPKIDLQITYHNNFYYIVVSNSIPRSVLSNNPDLISTKKDKEDSGNGTRSMRKVVKSYGGNIDFYEDGLQFIVHITFPKKITSSSRETIKA